MKNLFPGHYRPSEDNFRSLWTNGHFVFDTNVLLNLYSYPDSAREAFFAVLEKVSERSWIPYQVALEFHRNRFSRIKSSNLPLISLRDRIRETSKGLERDIQSIEFEKRNTGVDNLHDRLAAVKQANELLAAALDEACNRLPKIGLDDPIGARLAEIFAERVGERPKTQEELDALTLDGSERYEKKIPPGFRDAKDKKDLQYRDKGLTYQAMYGDLILWRQTIDHVRAAGLKDVIFITGDGKDDWWQTVDNKILGPSPELIAEFLSNSGAQRFWMYPADQFLKNSEIYLEVKDVTPEMIAQVKETSDNQTLLFDSDVFRTEFADLWSSSKMRPNDEHAQSKWRQYFSHSFDERNIDSAISDISENVGLKYSFVEHSVQKWAMSLHNSDQVIKMEYPDFAIVAEDGMHGYEIIIPRRWRRSAIEEKIQKASKYAQHLPCTISLVVILDRDLTDATVERYINDFAAIINDTMVASVAIGYVFNGYFMPSSVIKNSEYNLTRNRNNGKTA